MSFSIDYTNPKFLINNIFKKYFHLIDNCILKDKKLYHEILNEQKKENGCKECKFMFNQLKIFLSTIITNNDHKFLKKEKYESQYVNKVVNIQKQGICHNTNCICKKFNQNNNKICFELSKYFYFVEKFKTAKIILYDEHLIYKNNKNKISKDIFYNVGNKFNTTIIKNNASRFYLCKNIILYNISKKNSWFNIDEYLKILKDNHFKIEHLIIIGNINFNKLEIKEYIPKLSFVYSDNIISFNINNNINKLNILYSNINNLFISNNNNNLNNFLTFNVFNSVFNKIQVYNVDKVNMINCNIKSLLISNVNYILINSAIKLVFKLLNNIQSLNIHNSKFYFSDDFISFNINQFKIISSKFDNINNDYMFYSTKLILIDIINLPSDLTIYSEDIKINHCHSITTINLKNNPKLISIFNCKNLINLKGNVKYLTTTYIRLCNKLNFISEFNNIIILMLIDCPNLKDINGNFSNLLDIFIRGVFHVSNHLVLNKIYNILNHVYKEESIKYIIPYSINDKIKRQFNINVTNDNAIEN